MTSTSNIFDDLLVAHTVVVRRLLGQGSSGPRYAAAADLPCTVNEQQQITVSAAGNVTGTVTTIAYRVEYAALINVGSLVTLPSGREAEVVSNQVTTDVGPITNMNAGIAVVS
jgi:hypothetical protein